MIPDAALAFLLLLFPTGRLRSRRWRPAAWFVAGIFGVATVTVLIAATRTWAHPFAGFSQAVTRPVLTVLLIGFPVALLVSLAAIVVRFARSAGDERLQLKWFAAAALLVVATFIASILTSSTAANVVNDLAFLCLYAAIAIAVLKHRLYEMDLVISKAVLYGSLAVFITAVYAALVVGVGTLAGNRHSAVLSAVAAAIVAIAFQPARQKAGRLANRLVYGSRATPYQVLSDFARRVRGRERGPGPAPRRRRDDARAAGRGHERPGAAPGRLARRDLDPDAQGRAAAPSR